MRGFFLEQVRKLFSACIRKVLTNPGITDIKSNSSAHQEMSNGFTVEFDIPKEALVIEYLSGWILFFEN